MKKLVIDESLIPYGYYCNGCPYYHWRPLIYKDEPGCQSMSGRGMGFCDKLRTDDNGLYKEGHHYSMLWDCIKECGINYNHLEEAEGLKVTDCNYPLDGETK